MTLENKKDFELNELCGLISIIHRKTQIYLNQELKKYSLNSAEFVYLIHIRGEDPMPLKTLSGHLRMDDAQTSRIVKSLEEKGLLEKLRSREDGRAFEVRLTEQGQTLRPKILEDLFHWIREITEGIPEDELQPFINNLGITARNATLLTEGE